MEDKIPSLTKLFNNETRILSDNCIKYHIITTIIDYLVIAKKLWKQDEVSYKDVMKWLDKRSVYIYECGTSVARIQLWIKEMEWLELISFNDETQRMKLTDNGYSAYKNQQHHFAYSSLLEAKWSRIVCLTSLIIALLAFTVSVISIIL